MGHGPSGPKPPAGGIEDHSTKDFGSRGAQNLRSKMTPHDSSRTLTDLTSGRQLYMSILLLMRNQTQPAHLRPGQHSHLSGYPGDKVIAHLRGLTFTSFGSPQSSTVTPPNSAARLSNVMKQRATSCVSMCVDDTQPRGDATSMEHRSTSKPSRRRSKIRSISLNRSAEPI